MPVSFPTFGSAAAARWEEAEAHDTEVCAPLMARFAADALALAGVDAPCRILDSATGTGALALRALERGAEVTALDPAPAAIDRLRWRLSPEQRWRTSALVMDGQAFELPDGIFDSAFSLFGLLRLPNPARGLDELRRVLKPGGRLVAAAWSAPARNEVFQLTSAARRAFAPAASGAPEPAGWFCFQDAAVFTAALANAGFGQIAVHTIAQVWKLPSVDAFVEHAPAVVEPTPHRHEPVSPAAEAAFRHVLRRTLQTRFGPGPVSFRVEAHLASGIRL